MPRPLATILARGLNIQKGDLTYKAVADSLGLPFKPWAA